LKYKKKAGENNVQPTIASKSWQLRLHRTLVRPVPIVGMQLFGFSIGLRVAVIGLISRVAMAHFC